jgi:transketolase
MRTTFVKTLSALARQDERVYLLTGDLGYSVLEEFRDNFRGRFYNVGVAEANMAGVAAGLALSGKLPYIYSIATFAVLRCLEQIRNDICYHNLNVKVIGVGSGLSYSLYGASHESIEDIAMMRSLPNMVVACPGDPMETEVVLQEAYRHPGPVYVRLATKGEPVLHTTRPELPVGRGVVLKSGKDLALIATGNMLENARSVALALEKEGIHAHLVSLPYVKPIDRQLIRAAATQTGAIFTLEEHCLTGGLGSAVAEVLAEDCPGRVLFKRIALPDRFPPEVGSRAYLRNIYGLSVEGIIGTIKQTLRTGKMPEPGT